MTSAAPERVERVRSFNRFYTRRIGLLGPGLLGTPHPLPQARVLYELGSDPIEVGELRRALEMDPGHLSRMLTRLEGEGLLTRERSAGDARRQVVRLTAAGGRARAKLDRRSAREIEGLLSGLPEPAQEQLLDGMAAVQASLDPAAEREVVLRAPEPGDFGWIVSRHGALYAAEFGWGTRFEVLIARIVADFAEAYDTRREAAWIVTVEGRHAGCVLCVAGDDPAVARLRLLLVEPFARGIGLGTRLVDECIEFARAAGYERLDLWTHDVLRAARTIYDRKGFTLVGEQRHRQFGVDVLGQDLTLSLGPPL